MKTIQPRKQRKRFYNAPLHQKRKWIASHLSESLLLKYDKRGVTLIKGDTVKVLRGSYRGHEDKIVAVNVPEQTVHIEGLTMVKADGTKIPKPIHASNLLITKLNLTDNWRRRSLEKGLSENVKKEIEAEAKQQLKEEQRKEQEQPEPEPDNDETEEEIIPEKTPTIKKTEPKEKKSAAKPKTPAKKAPATKKTAEKKPTTKKTPVKKTTPKKKKEEENK